MIMSKMDQSFSMNGYSVRMATDQDDAPYIMTMPASGKISTDAVDAASYFGVSARSPIDNAPIHHKSAPKAKPRPAKPVKVATPDEILATAAAAENRSLTDVFSVHNEAAIAQRAMVGAPVTKYRERTVILPNGEERVWKPVTTRSQRVVPSFVSKHGAVLSTRPNVQREFKTTSEWVAEGQRAGYIKKSWFQAFSDSILTPAQSFFKDAKAKAYAFAESCGLTGVGLVRKFATAAIGGTIVVSGMLFGQGEQSSQPVKQTQNIADTAHAEKPVSVPATEKPVSVLNSSSLFKQEVNDVFGKTTHEPHNDFLFSSPKNGKIFSDEPLLLAPGQSVQRSSSPFSSVEIPNPYPG